MQTALVRKDNLTQIETLGDLFAWRVHQTPCVEAYREFDQDLNEWVSYTWLQMAARVEQWRSALERLNLPQGARVGILLPNSTNAVCIDQSSLALGMVPVPMHAIDNPESIAYILRDCDASVLVLSTRAQWDAIANVGQSMPALKLVVIAIKKEGELLHKPPTSPALSTSLVSSSVSVVTLDNWLTPKNISNVLQKADDFDSLALSELSGDALAAIVYTSGTTGKPKGVMLTHANVLSNVKAILALVSVNENDVFLSFLPLSHTFERTIGYYLAIAAGSCVAYVRSVAQIAEDLKLIKPTILVSVPRIYERFYAKLKEMLGQSGCLTRLIFAGTQKVGWRQFCDKQKYSELSPSSQLLPSVNDQKSSNHQKTSCIVDVLLKPFFRLLHPLIARKVLAHFGGNLRFAVCGGAPIPASVAQCFLSFGLPLIQGYGMTETSPVVCANNIDDNWPDTVGRTIQGVQVRIGENRELQVYGNGIMKGYWKRPQDTAAVMMEDGWLKTGDQAVIQDGRVRIIGRIKEIMVTSTGEKIAPVDLEQAIMADTLFEQAFVVGENRPFIAAFVVLNQNFWEKLAQNLKIDAGDHANLHKELVRDVILKRIQQVTKNLPSYAMPRAVWVTLDVWSIQNGLITPTLKLKRHALHAFFQRAIDEIYLSRSH